MSAAPDDPRWTAFLLGELSPEDTAEMENRLAKDPEARERLEELQETLGLLRHVLAGADAPEMEPLRREAVRKSLKPGRRLPAWFPASAAALLATGLGIGSYLAWRSTPPPLSESEWLFDDLSLAEEAADLDMAEDTKGKDLFYRADDSESALDKVQESKRAWHASEMNAPVEPGLPAPASAPRALVLEAAPADARFRARLQAVDELGRGVRRSGEVGAAEAGPSPEILERAESPAPPSVAFAASGFMALGEDGHSISNLVELGTHDALGTNESLTLPLGLSAFDSVGGLIQTQGWTSATNLLEGVETPAQTPPLPPATAPARPEPPPNAP